MLERAKASRNDVLMADSIKQLYQSQNHTAVGVGRDLRTPPRPTDSDIPSSHQGPWLSPVASLPAGQATCKVHIQTG